jgi:hypothetical protein
MRLDLFDGEESSRVIGAAVVRPSSAGEVLLDIGPADGAPIVRLGLNHSEAVQLGKAMLQAANDGQETVLIVDA